MQHTWEGWEMHTDFLSENLEERNHSKDLGVHGKMVLERILGEVGWEVVDWMRVAQDTDQWRALVSTVMIFRVP